MVWSFSTSTKHFIFWGLRAPHFLLSLEDDAMTKTMSEELEELRKINKADGGCYEYTFVDGHWRSRSVGDL